MKLLSLFLCLFFLLSLCGCAEQNEDPTDFPKITTPSLYKPEIEPVTEPATEPATEPVTEPILEPAPIQPIVTEPLPEPDDDCFVKIGDYIPNICIDLRYASTNNFTGQTIYHFSNPYLRYGTVKKLINVQKELENIGLTLLIWDAFRPVSAQFTLWEICPDSTYVANPYNGFSAHSRGNTVDISIVYADGSPVTMPTDFDDFSPLANRDYSDCSAEAAENAQLLEGLMEKHGFRGYYGEWWHYTDSQSYPVEESFDPGNP